MPSNFGETISPKELEDLVEYLAAETGAAKSGSKAGGSQKPKGG